MHHASLGPGIICSQLDEAYQLLLKVRADKNARIRERRTHLANGIERLTVVWEAPPLPYRAFIVDFPDAVGECVIKLHLTNDHALLAGLFRFVPGLEADCFRPPIVERRNRKNG